MRAAFVRACARFLLTSRAPDLQLGRTPVVPVAAVSLAIRNRFRIRFVATAVRDVRASFLVNRAIGNMREILTERSGTTFDSTLIDWVNERGIGVSQSYTRAPLAFIGSAHSHLATGRNIKFARGSSMSNDLTTMADARGALPGVNGNSILGVSRFFTGVKA